MVLTYLLWIRPKVCQRSGVVRDVLGALYAVSLKCAGFCVVRDVWQTGGGGVGGMGGKIWWALDT
jgi:hypothetical protein